MPDVLPRVSPRRSLMMLIAGFGLVGVGLGACTGDDGPEDGSSDSDADQPAVVSSVVPVEALPDCPVEPADPPETWPLELPAGLVVVDFAVDGTTFTASGVTNDAEGLLVQAMDVTLASYQVAEPEGGASDIVVAFESGDSGGTLAMNDEDGDDCWDVELGLTFVTEPDDASFLPTSPDDDQASTDSGGSERDTDAASGLVEQLGSGSVTTARGTFPLALSQCELDPVRIVGTAELGRLEVSGGGEAPVALAWSYDDGPVIEDSTSRLIPSSDVSALIVADGRNDEGPETVIVEVLCSSG